MIDAALASASDALSHAAGAVVSVAQETPTFLAKVGSPQSQAVIAGGAIVVYGAALTAIAVVAAAPYVASAASSAYDYVADHANSIYEWAWSALPSRQVVVAPAATV